MTKNYLLIFAGVLSFSAFSQTNTADFEDLALPLDTFWNGSNLSGGFNSGMVRFQNQYDTTWGGSWKKFAYSTMRDTTTASYANQYSCISGKGVGSSATYGVGYFNGTDFPSLFSLVTPSSGVTLFKGVYLNNTTYAYLSMKNGDSFAKKFGDSTDVSGSLDGTSGRDWLKLTIYGSTDSLEFYLADYRGPDSTDYIIKDWTYVDLTPLNENMSLSFKLTSSDNGAFGMNTPGYFCLDSLIYEGVTSLSEVQKFSISVYPNPTQNSVKISFESNKVSGFYRVTDIAGREVMNGNFSELNSVELDLSNEKNGVYLLSVSKGNSIITRKIIKH